MSGQALTRVVPDASPHDRSTDRLGLPTTTAIWVAVVVGAAIFSVLVGARAVPLAAVFDVDHVLHPVVEARIERTFLGLAVGASLGLAGALMQGLTRNPLADPGILGVNAGATFAMVVAMAVFGLTSMAAFLPVAFLGAAAAAVLVHAIASLGRDGATPIKLAITGAALSAGLASWTTGILLADRKTMESFRFWQVGTVAGRGFDVLLIGLPFLLLGALLALAGARLLNTLALGDDLARGLGRNTARDRAFLGIAIVLLAGTATALAGPIAFVGLVVPHVVRSLIGTDYTRVLPFAMLGGATLVVLADTIGRIVLPPSEVQVGIMCAFVGVPFFLVLIRRPGRSL